MNEPTNPEIEPEADSSAEVPLFQTPGVETPGPDAADDDFINPPILRDIRPSFWDFCNKTNN